MHIIVLKNQKYMVVEPKHLPNPEFDFYDACDILREALSTFNDEINRWIMNDGSGVFFGCIHLP
jgi:hypothetical protein